MLGVGDSDRWPVVIDIAAAALLPSILCLFEVDMADVR